MSRALVLALALSGGAARGQDGGLPPVLDVELATVTQPDGGVVLVTGGAWLRDDILLARAEDLQRQAPSPTPPASPAVLLVTAVISALAGYVGGLLTPRP